MGFKGSKRLSNKFDFKNGVTAFPKLVWISKELMASTISVYNNVLNYALISRRMVDLVKQFISFLCINSHYNFIGCVAKFKSVNFLVVSVFPCHESEIRIKKF